MEEHFHDIINGCVTIPFVRKSVTDPRSCLNCLRCLTHNIDICKCGWEYGYHFDTEFCRGEYDPYKGCIDEYGYHLPNSGTCYAKVIENEQREFSIV